MRKIQVMLVILFCLVGAAFAATFAYNTFARDREPPRLTSSVDYVTVEAKTDPADMIDDLLVGLEAEDNQDGYITDRIQVKSISSLIGANTARVTYVVFDSASNAATLTRDVHYSNYRKPRFALSQPLIYGVSQTVTLLDRLTAYDVIDGDLSGKMQLTMLNLVNTVEGTYKLNVMVSNSLGDSTVLPLTVTMKNVPHGAPTVELTEYLTYTDAQNPLDLKEFVKSVKDPSQPAASPSADDVQITSNIDYTVPGVYEVMYSYTGSTGLQYDVILTVVVE